MAAPAAAPTQLEAGGYLEAAALLLLLLLGFGFGFCLDPLVSLLVPELYYLIARFLQSGPCKKSAQVSWPGEAPARAGWGREEDESLPRSKGGALRIAATSRTRVLYWGGGGGRSSLSLARVVYFRVNRHAPSSSSQVGVMLEGNHPPPQLPPLLNAHVCLLRYWWRNWKSIR